MDRRQLLGRGGRLRVETVCRSVGGLPVTCRRHGERKGACDGAVRGLWERLRHGFEVHARGAVHTFDSFECAIQRMAPVCEHCGCKVIGHGVQAGDSFYCCAHCAQSVGASELRDRA